jgi:hypothetical protein
MGAKHQPGHRSLVGLLGLLFWLGLIAGLLLYLLSNAERRRQVTGALSTTYDQATELYRDFRGYNGEA